MSLFVRRNEESAPTPSLSTVSPVRALEPVHVESAEEEPECDYFGKGSRIQGKLRCEGSVRIGGVIEGEIDAIEGVIVEQGAEVLARITAATVLVNGHVNADIHAHVRLEIGPSGVVRGKVTAAALVIHEGAIFEGSCSMDESREPLKIAASA